MHQRGRSRRERLHRRQDSRLAAAGPAGEGLLGGVEGLVRFDVADQDQGRAGRVDPGGVQVAQCGCLDGADVVGGRGLHTVRVVGVHTFEQRDPGQVGRLGLGDADPVGEPVAFGTDLAVGVGRAGEDHGEQVEDPVQPVAEAVAGDHQPVGVDAGRQRPADGLQRGGDVDGGHRLGTGQQRLPEDGRGGQVDAGERDPQPQLDQRDRGAVRGDDGQPVGQGALGGHRYGQLAHRPEVGYGLHRPTASCRFVPAAVLVLTPLLPG